jgi:2,3-bisphosphoglycerate-dependent phosphoglycerate mutase
MKKTYFVVLLFAVVFTEVQSQEKGITTFILIRHAEKENDGTADPDLKPEGVIRAKRIASMFAHTPIDVIYSTNYKRTKNTVTPVADARGLVIQHYEAFKADDIESMLQKYSGKTILISGHSNNTPWIANHLTGKKEFTDYAESEYGIILIVSITEKATKVLRLDY